MEPWGGGSDDYYEYNVGLPARSKEEARDEAALEGDRLHVDDLIMNHQDGSFLVSPISSLLYK